MVEYKNLKRKYYQFLSRFKSKPHWEGQNEFTIVPAFACGGIQYYEIQGLFAYPCKRALDATAVFEEVQMRVTKEYLQGHIEAVKQILSDAKKINILELSRLYNELDDRLTWIVSPESIYKLASVVYFDKTESLYEWDMGYSQKKIQNWKKHGVKDFFLREPIRRYIPQSNMQESDLIQFIQTAMNLERAQSENLLQQISKTHSMKDFYKSLSLRTGAFQSTTH